MKANITNALPFLLKPFGLSLVLSLSFLIFLAHQTPHHRKTTAVQQPHETFFDSDDIRMRPDFSSYDSYVRKQLNRTLDPILQKIWLTRDWSRRVSVFFQFFQNLKRRHFVFNTSRALSIGAQVGQEVAALKLIGVSNSIGIDLVPHPPLVIKGNFHAQPFDNETFDFEFSIVFDHALYPWEFIEEIERTLKIGGICVLHVTVSRRSDKYSANDLFSVKPLVEMF